MKCTIWIEDDNNTIAKAVCDDAGNFDSFYTRQNMLECFLTAMQGMGYGFGKYNTEDLAGEMESLIFDGGPAQS